MTQKTSHFIATLQQEAKRQSSLSQTRILPSQLDPVTTFIGNYPWQTVFILSGLSALALEFLSRWTK